MPSILICSHQQKNIDILSEYFIAHGYHDFVVAFTSDQAIELIKKQVFTMVFVDLPFTQDTHEFTSLCAMAQLSHATFIVMVKRNHYDLVRAKVVEYGIFTIMKPIDKDVLIQLMAFAQAALHRYHHAMKKQAQMVKKIKEIKLIDRAKCLLIQNEYITEEEAHKRLEKEAMNQRKTRLEIANAIIREYEEG